MNNVLVIGAGRAGLRFVKTINYIAQKQGGINISAVVDREASRLTQFSASGVATYQQLDQAFAKGQYDIIIIAVNEAHHYAIYQYLASNNISYKAIVSEKPFTATAEEAKTVSGWLENKHVYLNFVERYSPLSALLYQWMDENDFQVKRADFAWGKSRINDPRPTIGIMSEISHPLDIILWLIKVNSATRFEVRSCGLINSNISIHNANTWDSIYTTFECISDRNTLVSGCSSFVWSQRERRIQIFMGHQGQDCITHEATLVFDNPRWDCDQLEISEILPQGGKKTLLRQAINEADIDDGILSLNKIYRFLNMLIATIDGEQPSPNLATVKDGLYVHQIAEKLEQAGKLSLATAAEFTFDKGNKDDLVKKEEISLEKYLKSKSKDYNATPLDGLF